MSEGFADLLCHRVSGLRPTFEKTIRSKGLVFPPWDTAVRRYVYNLGTKQRFSDKPDYLILLSTLESLTLIQQPNSFEHCTSADGRMSEGFADLL